MNQYDSLTNDQLYDRHEQVIKESWAIERSHPASYGFSQEEREKMAYNERERHMLEREIARRKRKGQATSYWKQTHGTES